MLEEVGRDVHQLFLSVKRADRGRDEDKDSLFFSDVGLEHWSHSLGELVFAVPQVFYDNVEKSHGGRMLEVGLAAEGPALEEKLKEGVQV